MADFLTQGNHRRERRSRGAPRSSGVKTFEATAGLAGLGCLLIAVSLIQMEPAQAHGDGFPFLYVDVNGVDDGLCVDPDRPCRTIKYALRKAEKGDEIRVGPGTHRFATDHSADALDLLGRIKRVRGGFDPKEKFVKRTDDARVSVLVGPAQDYRRALADNGFLLLPDRSDDGGAELRLAQAQEPAPQTRYVSEGGTDTGDCLSPNAPCLTIAYALQQATPGQEIRVGEGYFDMEPGTMELASARNIRIQGGFARASNFRALATDANLPELATVVTGPSFRDRVQLAQSGFRLQQDRKHLAVAPPAGPATPKGPATCVAGMADGHPCKGIDRLAQLPLTAFGAGPAEANDIWGFVDLNDNREYAIIGLQNATSVVDVSDPTSPKEVGFVPGQPTIWRDIKVYQFQDDSTGKWKAYAFVTADDRQGVSHGIQIIDLTKLSDPDPDERRISLAVTLDLVDIAHNVYISNVDYATGATLPGATPFVYILGSNFGPQSTAGAFFVLDVSDPVNPTVVQTPPVGSSYTHDATTLTIDDSRAAVCKASPCEILIDYSEDAIDVWDMTVKGNAHKLGSVTYPDANYIHSGWWTEDKNFVLVQDELDEQDAGLKTTVRVLDIRDLENPEVVAVWTGPSDAIDHNGFVLGDEYYMSNYRRGLAVLDIANPAGLAELSGQEKALFDTYIDDPRDDAKFNGAWGTYPYLPSGTILVSDIEGGLFLLKKQ